MTQKVKYPSKTKFIQLKNHRKLVLEEDDYLEDIAKIVQRDFFPDIELIDLKLKYYDAVESNDSEQMAQIEAAYNSRVDFDAYYAKRPSLDSPWSTLSKDIRDIKLRGATPASSDKHGQIVAAEEAGGGEGHAWNPPPQERTHQLSLNQYLARHTSEDDESFVKLMEKIRNQERQRLEKFFPQSITNMIEGPNVLCAITSSTGAGDDDVTVAALPSINGDSDATNDRDGGDSKALMRTDQSSSSASSLSACGQLVASLRDQRPDLRVANTVFFPPSGAALNTTEINSLLNDRPEICHENTGFKRPLFPIGQMRKRLREASASGVLQQPAGRFDSDGKEITIQAAVQSIHSAAAGTAASESVRNDVTTATVNNTKQAFACLRASPSPCPGAANESPLITWGQIAATPFRLNTPGVAGGGGEYDAHDKMEEAIAAEEAAAAKMPRYRMLPLSKRDLLARKLSDDINRDKKQEKQRALERLRSHLVSSKVLGNMSSPLVQRVLSNHLNSKQPHYQQHHQHGSRTPGASMSRPGSSISRISSSSSASQLAASSLANLKRKQFAGSDLPGRLGSAASLQSRRPSSSAVSLSSRWLASPAVKSKFQRQQHKNASCVSSSRPSTAELEKHQNVEPDHSNITDNLLDLTATFKK